MSNIRGRFVWHELMTTDTKAAGAFYPKVTNWKTQVWDKDPSYTMWAVAKGPFGGLRTLPDAARAAGPHWLPYIGTDSVDATLQSAQGLGARVYMGATDIPSTGRFAVLADPQGAVFAIFSPLASTDGEGSMPQEFSWHELASTDPVAALRFYGELFGWSQVAAHDMGPAGVYHLVGLSGVASIGMWKTTAEKPMPPHWLCYAHVTDIDKAANAAKAAGGKVLNGPMEVPGGTWIAHLTDPQGAAIALHADKRLSAAAPTPQPPKVTAPQSVAAPAGAKPQPPTLKASTPSAVPAKPQAPASVSAAAAKPAASKTPAAKAPAAKKAPAKKAPAKKAARKAAAKKSPARKRPKKSKKAAKRVTRKAPAKRKSAKKRAKASKRRSPGGRLEVARRFAAKQAGSLLKRLRGRKHR